MGETSAKPHPASSMTPGQRTQYKMMRITPPGHPWKMGPWHTLPPDIQKAFEDIAVTNPDVVPTVEEIIERDSEMRKAANIR